MKFRLLFLAAFASLISCSSDDNTSPIEQQEKQLKKITTYTGESFSSETLLFEENKLKTRFYLNSQSENNEYLREEYFYNENGLLDYKETYKDQTLMYKNEFFYDASSKIISYKIISYPVFDQPDYVINVNYIYEEDKVIAMTDENSPADVYYEFYLNSIGQINKIDAYGDITEVTYQDGELVSWSKDETTILYTYNEEVLPKGDYLNYYKNMFGTYTQNLVLFGAGFSLLIDSPNSYLSEESSSFETYTYEYLYDDQGYPISKKKINNGNVIEEDIIEYQ